MYGALGGPVPLQALVVVEPQAGSEQLSGPLIICKVTVLLLVSAALRRGDEMPVKSKWIVYTEVVCNRRAANSQKEHSRLEQRSIAFFSRGPDRHTLGFAGQEAK